MRSLLKILALCTGALLGAQSATPNEPAPASAAAKPASSGSRSALQGHPRREACETATDDDNIVRHGPWSVVHQQLTVTNCPDAGIISITSIFSQCMFDC